MSGESLVRTEGEGVATSAESWPHRIAMLGFLPNPQPVPRDMTTLIEGLVPAGVEVDLLLPPRVCGNPLDIRVPVGRYPLDLSNSAAAAVALDRYAGERRPDVILSNRDKAGAVLVRLSGEHALRIARIGTNVMEKTKGRHLLARWRTRRRLAAVLAEADGLIAVSEGACSALHRLLRGRTVPPIACVHSPIDMDAINNSAAAAAPHPWLLQKDLPVILSAGRLVRTKDYPTLIKAFKRVLQRRACRLMILGEGRQRPKLESLIGRLGLADAVALPGFVPDPFPYMARADLFVLSSRFEGFGNVLAEALAVGTTCVSTDCESGPREILGDGRYGDLVPVGSVSELANAISRSLERPVEPQRLREAALRFERDTVVAGFLETLRGMAATSAVSGPNISREAAKNAK